MQVVIKKLVLFYLCEFFSEVIHDLKHISLILMCCSAGHFKCAAEERN